jgi:hypothetical protein
MKIAKVIKKQRAQQKEKVSKLSPCCTTDCCADKDTRQNISNPK